MIIIFVLTAVCFFDIGQADDNHASAIQKTKSDEQSAVYEMDLYSKTEVLIKSCVMRNPAPLLIQIMVNLQCGSTDSSELGPEDCTGEKGICIEPITGPVTLFEGPHWDIDAQVLYFVAIPDQRLYRYDPATKKVTNTYIKNGQLGVAVPVVGQKNTFVGGAGTDFVEIIWDPRMNSSNPEIQVLAEVDTDREGTRFNDGKVDPSGRFWGGTMGIESEPKLGSLYRIGPNFQPEKIVSPVTISNGLTWNYDKNMFYYIDSTEREVWAYDYEDLTGDIYNKRVLFELDEYNIPGIPDGMTIDAAGNLWVAIYDGGRVISIEVNTGRLLNTISIPADQVTSVAFGGPNLDILYVTTARKNLTDEDLVSQPLAGCVFAVKGLGVTGTPMFGFKMNREDL